MKIELYYFDSCPSYEQALANAKEALRAEGLAETVQARDARVDERGAAITSLGSN